MIELECEVVCMQIHERKTPRYISVIGLTYDARELRVSVNYVNFRNLALAGLNDGGFFELKAIILLCLKKTLQTRAGGLGKPTYHSSIRTSIACFWMSFMGCETCHLIR